MSGIHPTLNLQEISADPSHDVRSQGSETAWSRTKGALEKRGLEGVLSDDHFLEMAALKRVKALLDVDQNLEIVSSR